MQGGIYDEILDTNELNIFYIYAKKWPAEVALDV